MFLFASALVVAILILLALVPLSQAVRTELLPALQASAATRTAGKNASSATRSRLAADWHLLRAAGLHGRAGA